MLSFIEFILFLGCIYLVFNPILTIWHEFGHALCALAVTNGPVQVYIGSFGDGADSWVIRRGRFSILFQKKWYKWDTGMCQHQPEDAAWRSNIITAGGPLANLLLSIVLVGYIWWAGIWHIWSIPLWVAYISFFVFLNTIYPSAKPLITHDENLMYCDGRQLYHAALQSFLLPRLNQIQTLIDNKAYSEAALGMEKVLKWGYFPRNYRKTIISLWAYAGKLDIAEKKLQQFKKKYQWLTVYETNYLGFTFGVNAAPALGRELFENYLLRNPQHQLCRTNLAFTLMLESDFQRACYILKGLLNEDPANAYALAHVAYCEYRLYGPSNELKQMTEALAIEPENPWLHRILGIYFYERGIWASAKTSFETALAFDSEILHAEEYLEKIDML